MRADAQRRHDRPAGAQWSVHIRAPSKVGGELPVLGIQRRACKGDRRTLGKRRAVGRRGDRYHRRGVRGNAHNRDRRGVRHAVHGTVVDDELGSIGSGHVGHEGRIHQGRLRESCGAARRDAGERPGKRQGIAVRITRSAPIQRHTGPSTGSSEEHRLVGPGIRHRRRVLVGREPGLTEAADDKVDVVHIHVQVAVDIRRMALRVPVRIEPEATAHRGYIQDVHHRVPVEIGIRGGGTDGRPTSAPRRRHPKDHRPGLVPKRDPAHVPAPRPAAEFSCGGINDHPAARGRAEMHPADVLAPAEAGEIPIPVVGDAVVQEAATGRVEAGQADPARVFPPQIPAQPVVLHQHAGATGPQGLGVNPSHVLTPGESGAIVVGVDIVSRYGRPTREPHTQDHQAQANPCYDISVLHGPPPFRGRISAIALSR